MTTTQAQQYLKVIYPLGLPPHLSDEDVAAMLDKEEKHRARARKAAATRKQRQEARRDRHVD